MSPLPHIPHDKNKVPADTHRHTEHESLPLMQFMNLKNEILGVYHKNEKKVFYFPHGVELIAAEHGNESVIDLYNGNKERIASLDFTTNHMTPSDLECHKPKQKLG